MKRPVLLVIGFLIALVVVVLLLQGSTPLTLKRFRRPQESRFNPVAAAKTVFQEARGEGIDLSRGPCLGLLGPDWVVDIAHEPRAPVDDDPANQCAEYRTGSAKHFVELTPNGKLIRFK